MSDPQDIFIAVDGYQYRGWSEATVTRSLDAMAHSFTLSYSAAGDANLGFQVGSQCTIWLAGKKLITGWVNQLDVDVSTDSCITSVSGRSKAGDLADCAAVHKTGQWLNQTIAQIVTDLCKPFAINVSVDPQVVAEAFKFAKFELDEAERVYDAMDRLLRATGTLAVSQADGSIRIMRIATDAGLRTVSLPVHLSIRRRLTQVDQDTFSVYRLRSQTGRANPEESPRHAALEKYEVTDPNVKRYRPFVLNADVHARVEELKDLAQWECNTRAAKSWTIEYELPGGLAPDGSPWEPGMLVGVQDPQLDLNDTYLVTQTEANVSNESLKTRLVLSLPDAYTLKPLAERRLNKGVSLKG